MASFTWDELITRARVYVDDDHSAEDNWIAPERWLDIGFTEWRTLYKRMIRNSLVTPDIQTAYLQGGITSINSVLAVVGVGQDMGNTVRVFPNAQAIFGRGAYWRGSTAPTGHSMSWAARGTSDTVKIELDPLPDDLTYDALATPQGNYLCRYIQTLTKPTATTDTVDLPDLADERLILGMARRAHLKDSANSVLLNDLIKEADAEMKFEADGKVGGIRVRRTPLVARATRLYNPYKALTWPGPTEWRFF